MKISSATIVPNFKNYLDARADVIATFDDGSSKHIFSFYPDEISFEAHEFIGLSEEQARALHRRRDIAFLQS